jgi:hypothetical protein
MDIFYMLEYQKRNSLVLTIVELLHIVEILLGGFFLFQQNLLVCYHETD